MVQFDENGNVGLASDLEIPNFANFPNFLQDLPNSIMTTQSYLISLKMRMKSLPPKKQTNLVFLRTSLQELELPNEATTVVLPLWKAVSGAQ